MLKPGDILKANLGFSGEWEVEVLELGVKGMVPGNDIRVRLIRKMNVNFQPFKDDGSVKTMLVGAIQLAPLK